MPELTLLADVSLERLAARRSLCPRWTNALPGRGDRLQDSMDRFQQRVLDLLTSETTQQAFRLSAEPDKRARLLWP